MTQEEWFKKIIDLIGKINDKHPELVKYLDEMPITLPDLKKPTIDLGVLKAYYNSLNILFDKYEFRAFVKMKRAEINT